MNVSLYQAAAAMNANARWQEMITENLAAGSVPGFRKQDISFATVEAGLGTSRHLMPVARTATNFQQGSVRPTGNPTDLALEGNGFFEVQLPNGAHAYTRDGEFQLNAQGQLVTKQGYTVVSNSGPLQFDVNNPAPISVSPAGEVSQGSDNKGRLHLVEFAQPQQLTAIGQGYFLADDPAAQPIDASATSVRQGYLEASNTSPTIEMASLITAMRMFETNQKVMQMQDERMGKAINELGGPS